MVVQNRVYMLSSFKFQFNSKLFVFVLLFLPLTTSLGFWQLSRAEEKRGLIAEFERLVQSPAIMLSAENLSAQLLENYQPVQLEGRFLPQVFLVDNQVYRGKVGYEVVQLFTLRPNLTDHDAQALALISRGFVEGSLDRSQLPQIATPNFDVHLQGYAYAPEKNSLLEGADASLRADGQWPKLIQQLAAENLYNLLPKSDKLAAHFLKPSIIRLDDASPYIFQSHWMVVNNSPAKHIGYAVQWFAMAALLVILFLWASVKRDERLPDA